ncbi:MAG: EscU/YscU/HrcU family type III secretion system export apparatus switch protein [Sphingomonas oligoaromativorans]|jgi:flagellar biosynthetic protein FlhB|uniref:EscU/YscU/HrcU family type III secretion system export apparatus switch protein n=1 Tax=Sphingomonas oligoaromativorans TaxID=575322 RepID=UPI001421F3B1|nr:flagellar type III secretion system protein FlhB [Sphingomonas oligoaromativorans]NIJ31998.1 flagellar biosynthetic protein FlhB [Sphingomonas oligoaromativorans]
MAEGEGGEKTEEPTQKRLKESAEKGDVLQSRELGTALVMIVGAGWIALGGPLLVQALAELLRGSLSFGRSAVDDFEPGATLATQLGRIALPLGLLFAATIVAAVGAPALLGAFGFRWGAIAFKPDKLNPLNGLKRIFGAQGLIELLKSLAKVAVMGGIGWWLLSSRLKGLTTLGRGDIRGTMIELGHSFVFAVIVMAMGLVLIAGIDVPAQMIRRTSRLRMSKQEVKDEHKQSEGSPELKGAIRRRQMEASRRSARSAVMEASVVLTNPTHFAVALRYRPGQDAAPIVVARGRGATADAIRSLAEEAKVPMLRYPQLARAIYFTTRSGHMIREDLYIAVATVLAFVFNIDRAMADGITQPVVEVPTEARFDENGRPDA